MNISFQDFTKISLKVGQIKEVQDHPNADKLYVLNVDLKEKIVELVAGIKANYSKEELLNKKIIVLDNLEPKKVRGIESQGMLLAADSKQGPVLVCPDKDTEIGCKIR